MCCYSEENWDFFGWGEEISEEKRDFFIGGGLLSAKPRFFLEPGLLEPDA